MKRWTRKIDFLFDLNPNFNWFFCRKNHNFFFYPIFCIQIGPKYFLNQKFLIRIFSKIIFHWFYFSFNFTKRRSKIFQINPITVKMPEKNRHNFCFQNQSHFQSKFGFSNLIENLNENSFYFQWLSIVKIND